MISRSLLCSIILLSVAPSATAMMPLLRSQTNRLAPHAKQVRKFSTQKPDQEPESIVVLGSSLLGATAGFVGGCMVSNLIDDGHYRNSKELDQMVHKTSALILTTTTLGAYQGTNFASALYSTTLSPRLRLLVTVAAASPFWLNILPYNF